MEQEGSHAPEWLRVSGDEQVVVPPHDCELPRGSSHLFIQHPPTLGHRLINFIQILAAASLMRAR
jgi:hypothetical protein